MLDRHSDLDSDLDHHDFGRIRRAGERLAGFGRAARSFGKPTLTHLQILIGATTGLAISLAFISAIGLSAAGPPIISTDLGPTRDIIAVSPDQQITPATHPRALASALTQLPLADTPLASTPVAYEQRDDVEVIIKRDGLPTDWRPQSTPPGATVPVLEPRLDPPPSFTKSIQIKKGGTLGQALSRVGTSGNESHEAIVALRKVFNLRRLRAGQEVNVRFTAAPDANKLTKLDGLTIAVEVDRMVVAERDPTGNFRAKVIEKELRQEFGRIAGTIQGSLFVAAQEAGLPVPLIMDLIRIYSWDVDFQREIQRGDHFEVLFDRYLDGDAAPSANAVKVGNIVYASLTLSGKELKLYRYRMADDRVDYFDPKGASVRKALLRTPIDGARLSSRYGKRRHPILGYTKMHRGVDFAAPRGTPIMAAGNGVVEVAGRNGAYGKYVRIRHNGQYKTAYAHLSRFGRGIRSGKRVNQGQIVGYVGSTGRSTGPHLHYEVLAGKRQVNPLSIKLPTGTKLRGKQLAAFETTKNKVARQRAEIPLSTKLASKP